MLPQMITVVNMTHPPGGPLLDKLLKFPLSKFLLSTTCWFRTSLCFVGHLCKTQIRMFVHCISKQLHVDTHGSPFNNSCNIYHVPSCC
jgi:hypothetical protein